MGLAVRCLPFDWGEHVDDMETVCSCGGLNSTPHFLKVNITSHFHCFRHVEKVDQRCPPVSTPHTVNMTIIFDLCMFYVDRCCWLLHHTGTSENGDNLSY